MTPVTLVAVAFVAAVVSAACLASLLADARREVRHLRRREAMLLDDLDYAVERADYWHKQTKAPRYREPHFETPEQFHQRQAMERQFAEHTADALAVIESPVVPLRPRGGA